MLKLAPGLFLLLENKNRGEIEFGRVSLSKRKTLLVILCLGWEYRFVMFSKLGKSNTCWSLIKFSKLVRFCSTHLACE